MKNNLIKRLFLAGAVLLTCFVAQAQNKSEGQVTSLTKAEFQAKVFDLQKNKNWKFIGNRPAIIDFYADWCGPCRRLAPIVSELASAYKGKVDVYKVDVDTEKELAVYFGISSIPVLLFIPQTGDPQKVTGLQPKANYEKLIKEFLLMK